jgi:hypothetical protein
MAPVLRVRFIVLALSLALLGAPAFAGQRAPAASEAQPTRGIVLRIVQLLSPFLEKLGPGMDPLGAPAPPPEAGPSTTPQGSQGDLGPGMDPLG